ncbi:hypothetical protein NE237_004242 [Protea cynaroides]|uniref:Uncharacterized protein n=1 Tax=Protea cynaroides TaxID=273540 RepID=A0A9Q0QTC9_9MAGN|nr:hypothetical protein NE237_004242 [Protea cynaroides]
MTKNQLPRQNQQFCQLFPLMLYHARYYLLKVSVQRFSFTVAMHAIIMGPILAASGVATLSNTQRHGYPAWDGKTEGLALNPTNVNGSDKDGWKLEVKILKRSARAQYGFFVDGGGNSFSDGSPFVAVSQPLSFSFVALGEAMAFAMGNGGSSST